ncbi:MAG TPA: hypothetical protein VFD69_16490 [Vicinamibacterales bacterium]|nr:hypothetical protein [Vicinamibacterales bacterium]
MRTIIRVVAVVCALALPLVAEAQFGHPLKGQWSGEWGPKDKPNRLLLNFEWDGKEITGAINPGPNAAVVKSVVFDYTNPSAWGVKITAEGKDASGKPLAITVDGKLENIGAYMRHLHGTWTQGGQKGEFAVTRN